MKKEKGKRSNNLKRALLTFGSLFFIFHFSFFISSCARQGYPTGGPKDEAAPVALGTSPANESRHFTENKFFIQFDEYVVLKNATENVLVSPPMKQKPEFTTKGKGVSVKINDTLQENTTYLFQFKDAIADFTEGNLLPSFEYVFSTGDAMDTLMLAGQVLDARSGKPWKEQVTVMAYKSEEDTLGLSTQPNFVTRCDKEGHFAFHYIPEGRYRIVALEDKNRNLRVDVDDAVAWDTVAMASVDSIDSSRIVTYFISQPPNHQQRLVSSTFVDKGRIVIVAQLPFEQPAIENIEAEWRLNSRKDTLTLWCLNAKQDSARFILSDPSGIQDTLKLKYTAKSTGSRRKLGIQEEKKTLMTALCSGTAAHYDDLRLSFANPITTMADSAMAEVMLTKDSSVSLYPIELDSAGLNARIVATLISGEKYHIHLARGLFTDLYGNLSDSLDFDLTPKDYGTLSIDIDNRMGFPLVIEVLDKRDSVVQQQALADSGKLRFIHLPSGDYRLRAVIDRNGDGRWTPGDYRQQRLPEETLMFEKTLQLREKWEMEEKWVVERTHKKIDKPEKKRLAPGRGKIPEGLVKPKLER